MVHSSLLAGEAGRLTSAEVRGTVFPSAGFSRGLNAEQVTRFMNRVAAELDALGSERDELEQEVGRLSGELAAAPGSSYLPPPVEQQAVHVLRRAQEGADRLMTDAQGQARSMVENGRRQREGMLADGRAQRERMLREAVDEAGREAARIAAQAPVDAQRQLAYYQSLADSVRAGLTAGLANISAQVRSWEQAEREGAASLRPRRPQTGPQPAVPGVPLA
jgi:DivIVA domain-containing protein